MCWTYSFPMRQLVIFDGDDTLWQSEQLYDTARDMARAVVENADHDAEEWERIERELDVRNVDLLGLSSERFPTSCVQAYEKLTALRGAEPDPNVSNEIRVAASTVFKLPAPPVEGASEALAELSRDCSLALLTQGDSPIQRLRVSQSGLEDFFDVIAGVDRKTPDSFMRLLTSFDASPDIAWSVGNSVPSDINPALSIGMRAIWIPAHVWEYEKREDQVAGPNLFVADSIHEVPPLILQEHHGTAASI